MTTKYLAVSVPSSITPSGHKDDAFASLQKAVNPTNGDVLSFNLPDFKVGTLDALLQQTEELAKLEGLCNAVVGKVGDTLKNILDGDEDKMAQHKSVNDSTFPLVSHGCAWSHSPLFAANICTLRRTSGPISQVFLMEQSQVSSRQAYLRTDRLATKGNGLDLVLVFLSNNVGEQEANSIDNDVRSKYNQYNNLRTTLQTLYRKQTGNLSTKSLVSIVNPDVLVSDSEHLETHLIAVPNNYVKDFLKTYETLAPFVVPRSAYFVSSDDEFSLYAVTTFKKHSPEFVHKVREKKWIPRDYKFKAGGKEEEAKELKRIEAEEKKVWGETLRLGRTGWSEGVMALVHVVVLRVFVETVLRYGLPLDYVSVLIKVGLLSDF